jgi:hypothetical protein
VGRTHRYRSDERAQRHFLIPAKVDSCWEVISGNADDATRRIRASQQARKNGPASIEFWNARVIRTTTRVDANACC